MAWAILKMCCYTSASKQTWSRGSLVCSPRPKKLYQCRHFSGDGSASVFLLKQMVSANKAFPSPYS